MPRIVNPGVLKTGHGKTAPNGSSAQPALSGAGLAGPGPNIGHPAVPAGVLPSHPLAVHVQDTKVAHQASAIGHDGAPDILISGNVEGALDELIGAVVQRPPYLGQWLQGLDFTGIPDWGRLKLRDASLHHYDLVAVPPGPLSNIPGSTNPEEVFPYYFASPGPAQDVEFTFAGEDPRTDWLWNTGLEVPGYVGAGYGKCHIGAFTRDGDVGPAPQVVMRTARLYPRPTSADPDTGTAWREAVTISGSIFPADRGVLALFHFPPESVDMQTDFLAQPLVTDETTIGAPTGRVVAALLLGTGILGEKCQSAIPCGGTQGCDGSSGGIFAVGTDPVTGKYNPFTFPGRASGQYDLKEIHLGVNSFGSELRAPWNDLDEDTVVGAVRTATATIPAPGQVRLGTDPDAGETPVDYGIPILGGTADYFDVAPTTQLGSLGHPVKGDSLLLDSNFFRYRLPVLADYSQETGLKWTPRGEDHLYTPEVHRFFAKATPLAQTYPDGEAVSSLTYLRTAGFYGSGFDKDYWTWQIARYRHTFLMPSTAVLGTREEVGSYWLVHFKREADFEKFARDGVFPWDVNDGYEVYGYTLAGSPPVHIEEDKNVVNTWPSAVDPVSPSGPAPDYGYSADPYHGVRSTIMMDPDGTTLPATLTAEWSWSSVSVPGTNEAVVWSSGVAYHTPRRSTNGATSFAVASIDLVLDAGFWTSYRTDSDDLTSGLAPARIASPNPLFLNVAPLAYGSGSPTLVVPTGLPGVGLVPDTSYLGRHRIEVPFEYLGSNGSGVFSDSNGPLDADDLTLSLPSPIEVQGDSLLPSFVRDARMRAYLRRPLNHIADNTTTLPFTADDGHGLDLPVLGGKQILFHSTKFDKTNRAGSFGNYVVAAVGTPPNTSYAELFRSSKTTDERFLDETFRVVPSLSAAAVSVPAVGGTPYTVDAINSLVGPGMQGWVGGPVEIPVKIGLATTPWNVASWLLNEYHIESLTLGDPEVRDGLQVEGLPDRNPPQSAAVQVPFPSAGMLGYPKEDYRPATPEGTVHFTGAQPDYSSATGVRQYVRVFDVAYRHYTDGSAMSLAGQTEFVLRLDGVTLEDIQYTAPGPGGLTDNRMALSIKVPGLTTWMDLGRPDGSGPSKQDIAADGAGCMVVGDETYSFQDPDTGLVGCYVKVNVGPYAALFSNTGTWAAYTSGNAIGESPIMLKVQMDDGAKDFYDMEHRKISGVFEVTSKPGAAPNTVRGLFGVHIVHPNEERIQSLADAGVVLP